MFSFSFRTIFLYTVLPLMVAALLMTSCADQNVEIKKGQGWMDLQKHETTDIIELNGYWKFFPDTLLAPSEITEDLQHTYIELPQIWNHKTHRYGTLSLQIVNHPFQEKFSIRNREIISAFRLFLNGELIVRNGKVSSIKNEAEAQYHPQITTITDTSDTLEFVLQFSNHHHNLSGVFGTPIIGSPQAVKTHTSRKRGIDFLLMGSLLMMALYHLGLYILRREDYSFLYFTIFILLIVLRVSTTSEATITLFFPQLDWSFLFKMEYLTFYLAPVFFLLFFNSLFRKEVNNRLVKVTTGISVLFSLSVLIFPVKIFSQWVIYFQIYVVILSIIILFCLWEARKQHRQSAFLMFLGSVIIFTTLINDIAHAYGSVRSTELVPVGLFVFILFQAHILSLKYSNIFNRNQKLARELDYQNKNLEQIVGVRTGELTRQKDMLEEANYELEQQKKSLQKQSDDMEHINKLLEIEQSKTDALLLNILPEKTARELKYEGKATTKSFPLVTVMFVDFVGFSDFAENVDPHDLIEELHCCFAAFDDIIRKHKLEKIKTIGDAYMCASGLHENASEKDVLLCLLAAKNIQQFMQNYRIEKTRRKEAFFDCRIGLHTGPVIGGVVGKTKFAFDIWGPTVNVAKRMESACEPGKINISEDTFILVRNQVNCTSRGLISIKHKKNLQMFFLNQVLLDKEELFK